MKTRTFVYLIVILALVTLLTGVACRGREQPAAQSPTQPSIIQQPAQPPIAPQPASGPSPTPFGGPPARTQPASGPSPTPFGGPPGSTKSDLVITETTVTPTAANSNQVQIHIVARNQGGPISAAFTIRWHPHQKDKGLVGCSQDFYNLNQSEWLVDCSYTYPGGERGEMHWVAVVDAENDVKNEANESNNEKTGTITIPSGGGQPPPPPAAQAPPAPTNCRTRVPTSGAGQVYVDWDFAGQPAPSGFRIYQGTTSLEKTVGGNERSVLLSNLTRGVQHHFDVRAYNAAGESRAEACSVDVTPPR